MINYTSVIKPTIFLEGQFSKKVGQTLDTGSQFTDIVRGTPIWDRLRGQARFNSPTFCAVCGDGWRENRDNWDWFAKLTYFLSTANAGSHNIVTGFDNYKETRRNNNWQSGSQFRVQATSTILDSGKIYPVFNSNNSTYIEHLPLVAESVGNDIRTYSAFFNDAWRYNQHMSFNLGFRYDQNRSKDQTGLPVVGDSKWSPRVGWSWDLAGDGKWIVNTAYARYVAAISTALVDAGSAGGRTATYSYFYQGPAINAGAGPYLTAAQALPQIFAWFNANGGLTRATRNAPSIPGVTTRVDGGTVAPNSNAYTVGLASELGGGRATWRVDYEYRDYADIYGDFRDTTTGRVTDPTGRAYDLVVVKNTPDAVRTYKGVNANVTYRVRAVQAGGNYTLSWARGNVAGEDAGSGPIRASLNDFPEYRNPSWNTPVGFVQNDQRHKVRAWLSYLLPATRAGDVTLGVVQRFDSALPYERTGSVDPRSYVTNPGYLTPPSTVTYYFSERFGLRWDNVWTTDLSANWSRKLPNLRKSEVFVRGVLANVFNNSGVVGGDSTALTAASPGTAQGPSAVQPVHDRPGRGRELDQGRHVRKALGRRRLSARAHVQLLGGYEVLDETRVRGLAGLGHRRIQPLPGTSIEPALGDFCGDDVQRGNRRDRDEQHARQRHEPEHADEWQIGYGEGQRDERHGRPQQHAAWPTSKKGPSRPDDQRDHELGEQRFDEPSRSEQVRPRPKYHQEHAEREEVEHRAHGPELHHEAANEAHVPALRPLDQFRIHGVVGDADRRHVGQQVVQEDLAGQERKERQEQRGGRHADHVAEVRAHRRQHVLQRVRKGLAAFLDASADDIQTSLEQDEIRRLPGHVNRLLNREARVRRVHGGRIVHAVAEKADDVPHLLERQDDPLLLVRIHLHEEIRGFGRAPERFVGQALKVTAREHAVGPHADERGDVLGDGLAVSRDDLDGHAERGQAANGVGHVLLRPVEKREEADEGEIPLQLPAVRWAGAPLFVTPRPGRGSPVRSRLDSAPRGVPSPRHRATPIGRSRADLEHVVKRALCDEGRLAFCLHDHADTLADEVERDFGQLSNGREIRRSGAEDRIVERTRQAGLERRVPGALLPHVCGRRSRGHRTHPPAPPRLRVSVPVLSVQRTSMLPRFSMAVRCRTSTPWRAIICAPRARLTLKMAGSSSGLSPTASATENNNVSIGGRPFSTWTMNTTKTMTSMALVSR